MSLMGLSMCQHIHVILVDLIPERLIWFSLYKADEENETKSSSGSSDEDEMEGILDTGVLWSFYT